jgi:hypothetical protein
MLDEIIKKFSLNYENLLSVFPYGSQVYGTANENSDYDYIVVCRDGSAQNDFAVTQENLSCHFYDELSFQDQLSRQKISAMECFFLPDNLVLLSKKKFNFKLNLETLRASISEKASHSWVKSKKKFEVEKDKDIYIAKKSLFHSFRIIDFGTQIAAHERIENYSSCNNLWEDIYTDPSERWDTYKEKYQELFNAHMTEFRKFAPKKVGN